MFPIAPSTGAEQTMGTDFESFLQEQLNDPELKAEYDALEPEFAAVQAQIDAQKTGPTVRDKVRAFEHLQELFGFLPGDIDSDKARGERLGE